MSASDQTTVSDDEDGLRLDRWIKQHFPGVPFGQLQQLLRSGQIRVDGARAKSSTRLLAGQKMRLPPMLRNRPAPQGEASVSSGDAAYLESLVLYQDRDLMVINKPAGLAVQGGSGIERHVDGMLEALRNKKGVKPRLVHRLDRATSGCLMIAMNRSTAAALGELLKARQTRKVYWAICYGLPKPDGGEIKRFLKRQASEDGDLMAIARHTDKGAQRALSRFQVLDHTAGRLSWVALSPVTGRTHQLRVHSQSIGHPIIGDPWYFNIENWQLPGGLQNKLHLHARLLQLTHPKTGEALTVKAPLPPHMHQSFKVLGFDPAKVPVDPDRFGIEAEDVWWRE